MRTIVTLHLHLAAAQGLQQQAVARAREMAALQGLQQALHQGLQQQALQEAIHLQHQQRYSGH
jgi:hypothetical protein